MPKLPSPKIKQFRVRVDGSDDERAIHFFKKYCETFLLVHHVLPHGNPHYHAYVETNISQGNFSNKIKAHFECVGSDYSNQVCNPDRKLEYLSYLFNKKQGNESRFVDSVGFSPIDIAIYQENAKTIADEFTTRMSKEKKTLFEVGLLVQERLGDENCVHPEVIYDEVISVLKENRMLAKPYIVKDIISSVMAYTQNRRANQRIKEITLKFFSPQ